jgi:hypothetical protein
LQEEFSDIEKIFLENYDEFFAIINANKEKAIEQDSDSTSLVVHNEDAANDSNIRIEEEKNAEGEGDAEEPSLEAKRPEEFLRDDVKKLYKKIVQITHPDKYPEYFTEKDKEKMLDIYKKCISGVKEGDLFSLLECASTLYLDIPELDKEDLKNLKKRSESIEENIQNMKNTYVWLWGQAADEEAKQKIVNKFLEQNSVK